MKNKNDFLRMIDVFLETCSENDLEFGEMKLTKAQFKNRFLLFVSQYEQNKKICSCELPREKHEEWLKSLEYNIKF